MSELELAIALSARSWPDEVHRFLADHGGARVRLTAMDPADLAAEAYHVLLIDDICSFLTPRLVEQVRGAGRQVVGLYDPDEFPDGKDRLLEAGVADVVEANADPEEILAVAVRAAGHASRPSTPPTGRRLARTVAVIGAGGGAGSTEVALAIATRLSRSTSVCLLDADPDAPSLAQRLRLPPHPNLRSAIDIVEHGGSGLHAVVRQGPGFGVIAGVRHADIRPHRVLAVIDALAGGEVLVVLDAGSRADLGLVARGGHLVVVAAGSPVGVVRLLDRLSELGAEHPPLHLLVNFAPGDRFRRGEIVEEVVSAVRPASLAFLPADPSVPDAGWDGVVVDRGRFCKSVSRWVDRFLAPGAT